MTSAAVGGVGNVLAEARSTFKHRRSLSVPQDLEYIAAGMAREAAAVERSSDSEGAGGGGSVTGDGLPPIGTRVKRNDSIAGYVFLL